jgi:hypothetical protein
MTFSTHDIVPDSPTNNFATLNPINNPDGTFSEGNLKWTSATTDQRIALATMPVDALGTSNSYCEILIGSKTSYLWAIGVFGNPKGWNPRIYYNSLGTVNNSASVTQTSAPTFAENDIMSMAYNVSTGVISFYKNGTLATTETVDSTDIIQYFGCASDSSGSSANYIFNFGQDPTFGGSKSPSTTYTDANGIGSFYYQPPTDALALCTANLPDFTPDVDDDTPQDYFKAVTYTGQTADSTFSDNGDNTWSKTGVGFQPDLVLVKRRESGNNWWTDSLRGVNSQISSSTTTIYTLNNNITSFDSDGFSLGDDLGHNASGGTYVAWCWKAGGAPSGSTSTTGSAKRINTSGTQDDTSCSALATAATNAGASNVITPTLMSINQAAGFSIVKYVGEFANRTIPHGLNSAPEMIIVKNLDDTRDWVVYQHEMSSDPKTDHLHLNLTEAVDDYPFWNDTAPTSTVFSIGAYSAVNKDGDSIIAYCWHSVEGYSKFGSYVGNGSADGPFVYCGFRPAFVMVKRTDATNSWCILDNAREAFNPVDKYLLADDAGSEGTSGLTFDFLSNGFKLKTSSAAVNASGGTYIFMAFAEQPFKFSNAR